MVNWIISECSELGIIGWEYYPLRIMQVIKIWPKNQMIFTQTSIHTRDWGACIYQGFWDRNGLLNPVEKNRPSVGYKKLMPSSWQQRENKIRQKGLENTWTLLEK